MNKKLLVLLIILCRLNLNAQVNYEKGYYIENSNVRKNCFIKNKNLYNNPETFLYKLNQEDNIVNAEDIKNIKEFGIGATIKYERYNVQIDTSSDDLDKLSGRIEPEWKQTTLFLKVLIEGDASLYLYRKGSFVRYFYKLKEGEIKQLVCKKYFDLNEDYVKYQQNNQFRNELWSNLRCNLSIDEVTKLDYNSHDLSSFFREYNNYKNKIFIDYKIKANKGSFNFKFGLGINVSSIESYNNSDVKMVYSGNEKYFPKYGMEIEYVLPFNRNKWALYSSAYYQAYKYSQVKTEHSSSGVLFENSYYSEQSVSGIDLSIGLRYYMYLSKNSSLFINGSFLIPSLGLGYSYRNKFNLQLKSGFDHTKFSLILGYTFYNNKKRTKND